MSERPIDPNVSQRRAADPSGSCWVSASAGTGKTKVLTDRVLRLMLEENHPNRILCLTYTKAAAAEMEIRIQKRLGKWAICTDEELEDDLYKLTGQRSDTDLRAHARHLFTLALDCSEGPRIQTIHSFCQSLLGRFPLEAGTLPHSKTIDERTGSELLAEALRKTLLLGQRDLQVDLNTAVSRLSNRWDENGFKELTEKMIKMRSSLRRHFTQNVGKADLRNKVYAGFGIEDEDLLAALCDQTLPDRLKLIESALLVGTKTNQEAAGVIQRFRIEMFARPSMINEYTSIFLTKDGTVRSRLLGKDAQEKFPHALELMQQEADRLIEGIDKIRRQNAAEDSLAFLIIARELLDQYDLLKRKSGVLDYDDLILATRRLFEEAGMASWVLYKLDGGIDHILVDEAQDTSPDQWEILRHLTGEFFSGQGACEQNRTFFVVGDEKQSIFSFQGADPKAFNKMRDFFAQRITDSGHNFNIIPLDISFRSTKAVLESVNFTLDHDPARAGVCNDPIDHIPFRRGMAGRVELWPLLSPPKKDKDTSNGDDGGTWKLPFSTHSHVSTAERMAGTIAAQIRKWLDIGEILPARDRAIDPGDILILVRKRAPFVVPMVRALKKLDIPVAGVDRMILPDQLVVKDLLSALSFVLLPEDDLTLAGLLKSPLIGLDDDDLFDLSYGRQASLWQALQHHEKMLNIRRYLQRLLHTGATSSPFELLAHILSRPCPANPVSGRKAILARLGFEVTDPIEELLGAAQAFEYIHQPSLHIFMHWLTKGQSEVKRELEQAKGAVRIMTVHASKGLQAPIVFMPDTVHFGSSIDPVLWGGEDENFPLLRRGEFRYLSQLHKDKIAQEKAKSEDEYRRLLYVAMTRAEDRLIISGFENERKAPDGCWYNLLHNAFEKAKFDEYTPHLQELSTAYGWDGTGLTLDIKQTAPPKSDNPQQEDSLPVSLPGWAQCPPPEEPLPPRPLVPSRPENPNPSKISPLDTHENKHIRRGEVIHGLLQHWPDLPPEERDVAYRHWLDTVGKDISPEERAQISSEVINILSHPDYAPLFGPNSRAEVSIAGLVGNNRTITGRIDRLVVTKNEVLIIDFKAGRLPPPSVRDIPLSYRHQMDAYRAALKEIYPDKPIRCFLLWTHAPKMMEIKE